MSVECPRCEGTGHQAAFVTGVPCTLLCDLCRGKGAITDEQAEWVKLAEPILKEQLGVRRLTTRKAAKSLGMTAVEYCDRRAGRADPTPILKAWGMEKDAQ